MHDSTRQPASGRGHVISGLTRSIARRLSDSIVFRRARALWEQNQESWNHPLSKTEKIAVGLQLILRDYADGTFPPRYTDAAAAYAAEKDYRRRAGIDVQQDAILEMRKPFWPAETENYLSDYAFLVRTLNRLGVEPPGPLLELGCGTGWMAEFLATMGYDVLGTDISEVVISDARRRAASLHAKGLPASLRFEVAAMEEAHARPWARSGFDAVFMYEALHHVFDWEAAVESAFRCVRPGGWLLICNEPNLVHTFVAYRVARLANTHEIGLSRRRMIRKLSHLGARPVTLRNRLHFLVRKHWLAAQRPATRGDARAG